MSILVWLVISVAGAAGWAALALHRGETINAAWLVLAAVCSYAVAYRFYSRFLATRVARLDDKRITPAHRLANGRDFVPTSRWILFGHHFAAIAGAGPLVGPVLAAQFGYLPGTIWIIVGVIFGGAVQDFIILAGSTRRDGKSLGQMAKEEIGPFTGVLAMIAILAIMVILIAVLALIIVKALAQSPWGVFTLLCTIPIALAMGLWMKAIRPGHTLEATAGGVVLLLFALVAGGWVAASPTLGPIFTLSATTISWGLMGYGFIASVLPVWLLLAPRDYLSTFVKVGTIFALAVGIALSLPVMHLPALTRFVDGTGPVFAGHLFPFCFITIACGAISGFHALVSSGTTPKMLDKESDARPIGYGAMLMESFVAVMAMCAASILQPGVYFAMNAPLALLGGSTAGAVQAVQHWGFTLAPGQMEALAHSVGETTLLARTGGAPTLAVGMAQILSGAFGPSLTALWYHFAIMFEALFILTTIDAGTRVGRFMVQELGGYLWQPLAQTSSWLSTIVASGAIVAAWGWFLLQGVNDPLGGINSLWPLFGIANQLLAAVALSVGTTLIIRASRVRYVWVTIVPLVWLLAVTSTASWQKVFDKDPHLGFLAHAADIATQITAGAIDPAKGGRLIFNDHVDAILCGLFLVITWAVVVASARVWLHSTTNPGPVAAAHALSAEAA
ncbi:MAG TPA: carbon starvation CstA family protein [Gemmatimonadales bacterium]|jgi:carbon starvation protein|nr:carbon starvation CstA family protein [Gemmatimonadales bacterium]